MENIACFLAGAEKLGVPKHDLFQTVDLYEKKNMTQVSQSSDTYSQHVAYGSVKVVDSIFSLSRHAYKAGSCSTVSNMHCIILLPSNTVTIVSGTKTS